MIKCKKCGYSEDQSLIHLHHLIPKSMGGVDLDGRKYLCKKCHDILHNMLIIQLWKNVSDKEKAKLDIKKFSLWWISK